MPISWYGFLMTTTRPMIASTISLFSELGCAIRTN
jgi:hypothetical protein